MIPAKDLPVDGSRGHVRDPRESVALALACGFVALAFAYALLPLRELYRDWNDFRWIYVSGRTWLEGASPYDFPRWAEHWVATPHAFFPEEPSQPFLYPPHWAVIAVPLAMLPYGVAIRTWDLIGVASYVATLGIVARFVAPYMPHRRGSIVLALLVGLATVHGSLRWSLWESQLALLPMLGVVGAFAAWREGRTGWLTLFAFLAALKPQIGILPLLFLLLNGGHRGVVLAGLVALAISVVALAPFGLARFPEQLADCYARHMNAGFNEKHTFSNLSALFASIAGGERFFWLSPALAVLGLAGLTTWRRVRADDPVANAPLVNLLLVGAMVPALLPLHGYDLVVLTPLVLAAVWIRELPIAVAFVGLVQTAGRIDFLERELGLHPLLPPVTSAILVVTVVAVARGRTTTRDEDDAYHERLRGRPRGAAGSRDVSSRG